jgi:hypothetical protein
VQSTAPGISTPAPAPPLDTAVSNPAATNPGRAPDATVPVDEAHNETLPECMSFWDAGTHMSKTEWLQSCHRTVNGTDLLGVAEPSASIAPANRHRGSARSTNY